MLIARTRHDSYQYEGIKIVDFSDWLSDFLRQSASRSTYQSFCRMLKGYGRDCGRETAERLADELRSEYYRRPAFIDELNRAGF